MRYNGLMLYYQGEVTEIINKVKRGLMLFEERK